MCDCINLLHISLAFIFGRADHDQIIQINIQSVFLKCPLMPGVSDIVYTFHIVGKKCDFSVTAVKKILCHQVSALFIVKTDINVSGNILWSVTVDKDSRFFVLTSDFEIIVVEHTDENQSFSVPAYYIAHNFFNIFRNINHHIIPLLTNRRFQSSQQFAVKWICEDILVFILSPF